MYVNGVDTMATQNIKMHSGQCAFNILKSLSPEKSQASHLSNAQASSASVVDSWSRLANHVSSGPTGIEQKHEGGPSLSSQEATSVAHPKYLFFALSSEHLRIDSQTVPASSNKLRR